MLWQCRPPGWVAEWSCTGLQIRVRRFDSGLSLHIFIRLGGEIGRRKGLKIPRSQGHPSSILGASSLHPFGITPAKAVHKFNK